MTTLYLTLVLPSIRLYDSTLLGPFQGLGNVYDDVLNHPLVFTQLPTPSTKSIYIAPYPPFYFLLHNHLHLLSIHPSNISYLQTLLSPRQVTLPCPTNNLLKTKYFCNYQYASAVVLSTPQSPAEITIWRRDDHAVTTAAATATETPTEDTDGENVPSDDAATGADDEVSAYGLKWRRKGKCRSDLDCDLGYLCGSGRCILGCLADKDCRRGQACLGGRCRTAGGANPPSCKPYKQLCAANEECCSGVCRLGWRLARECKHNKH
ncbi:hypothetical protein BDV41DRAFT_570122 [Aspergillus transmontanensis]|uniref:Dickkopf N-terminal cysteine-rich domain-containing protein n=1 Tax=Aspergillus transmontanensis TaxID=1034304 RepID=A0A5N6VD10_9EURO|nr:hypothetical protein BDV41DRAFT_570122 [Aspergillus transmontanensis]